MSETTSVSCTRELAQLGRLGQLLLFSIFYPLLNFPLPLLHHIPHVYPKTPAKKRWESASTESLDKTAVLHQLVLHDGLLPRLAFVSEFPPSEPLLFLSLPSLPALLLFFHTTSGTKNSVPNVAQILRTWILFKSIGYGAPIAGAPPKVGRQLVGNTR